MAALRKEYETAGLGESRDGGLGLLVPASTQGSGRQGPPTHRGSRAGTPPAALSRSPALSRQENCWKRRQTQQVPRNGHSYPGIL